MEFMVGDLGFRAFGGLGFGRRSVSVLGWGICVVLGTGLKFAD